MKLRLATVAFALLTQSLVPASAQAKPPALPDPVEVRRLQTDIARNQAKGDYRSAAFELRLLANSQPIFAPSQPSEGSPSEATSSKAPQYPTPPR